MTSLNEAKTYIENKYNELVNEAKQGINDDLRKACESSKAKCEERKLKIQKLKCTFPSSGSFGKLLEKPETRCSKKILKFVGDKKGFGTLQCRNLEAVERLPRMRAYLPMQRNILVEDSILDTVPYLGEDDNSDFYKQLFENIPIKKQQTELSLIDEMVFKDVVQESLKIQAESLRQGGEMVDIYNVIADVQVTKCEPKELRKKFKKLLKKEQKPFPSIDSKDATDHSFDQTLKKFQSKFCRRCFLYNCFIHKEQSVPEKNPHQLHAFNGKTDASVSCPDCYKNENGFEEESIEFDDVWNVSDISLFNILRQTFLDDFCAISRILQVKSCKQVQAYAQKLENQNIESIEVKDPEKTTPTEEKNNNEIFKAKVNVEKGKERNGDSTKTYKPCNHEGPCGKGCSCIENEILCEKFCKCFRKKTQIDSTSQLCKNRYKGCVCKSSCSTNSCYCRKVSHECDPDVCECKMPSKICQTQIGQTVEEKKCENVSVQLGLRKHLLLGKSDVAGWGIFTKDVIEKNEFISEYCGETIPEHETEQRGKIYDKLRSNFLFMLTVDHSIDSTRKGNKIRFSNHSSNPNCYCRRVFSNGDFHIAYYAIRRIEAEEELFVDYGESYLVHFEEINSVNEQS